MVEILFGENEAGCMREYISLLRNKNYNNQEIVGKIDDVIFLGFLLDIGDINEEVDSLYRKKLLCSRYEQELRGEYEKIDEELRKLCNVYYEELNRLKSYLSTGESVRVWYSDCPYSLCGFYHLCSILENYNSKVFVVKLPEYIYSKNCIISYNHWGEVAPEYFEKFLSYQKELSSLEIQVNAEVWNELKEDNSPLRALINGRIHGVPEDFYDFLLWKRITRKPEKQARVIGELLAFDRVGISDWWYTKRIDYYIQKGKIKVIEDSENEYARVICLS